MQAHPDESLPRFHFPDVESLGVVTAVTGRADGEGGSFDCSSHTVPTHKMRSNRERLAVALGVRPECLALVRQVHGRAVHEINELEDVAQQPEADALITNRCDVALAILTADCVAVGVTDPERRAIAMAHAGWRGTHANIVGEVVAAMTRSYDSNPRDMHCWIGPSIGPCCYEVGPEVIEAFYADHTEIADEVFSAPDFASAGSFEPAANEDHKYLDLWAANRLLLNQAGVPDTQIRVAEWCTSCHVDRLFSHRAEEGRAGRFAGAMRLLPS